MGNGDDTVVAAVILPDIKLKRLEKVLGGGPRGGVRFEIMTLADAKDLTPEMVMDRYGPFDAILHKLAHEMVMASLGNQVAKTRLDLMRDFEKKYKNQVTFIDPLESVRKLTDRRLACEMLRGLEKPLEEDEGIVFHVPKYKVVNSKDDFEELRSMIENEELALPVINKSIEACATDRSHKMSVITRVDDLHELEYSCLFQEYLNHSGRLFKGYVMGERIDVNVRASLPNLTEKAEHVHFDTQRQYPNHHDFHPTPDRTTSSASAAVPDLTAAPSSEQMEKIIADVKRIGERIKKEVKLSLFGYDVIIDDATNDYYVIDVNYFPSYKEVEDIDEALRSHVRKQCGRE